eukprot:scaffold11.g3844.t1
MDLRAQLRDVFLCLGVKELAEQNQRLGEQLLKGASSEDRAGFFQLALSSAGGLSNALPSARLARYKLCAYALRSNAGRPWCGTLLYVRDRLVERVGLEAQPQGAAELQGLARALTAACLDCFRRGEYGALGASSRDDLAREWLSTLLVAPLLRATCRSPAPAAAANGGLLVHGVLLELAQELAQQEQHGRHRTHGQQPLSRQERHAQHQAALTAAAALHAAADCLKQLLKLGGAGALEFSCPEVLLPLQGCIALLGPRLRPAAVEGLVGLCCGAMAQGAEWKVRRAAAETLTALARVLSSDARRPEPQQQPGADTGVAPADSGHGRGESGRQALRALAPRVVEAVGRHLKYDRVPQALRAVSGVASTSAADGKVAAPAVARPKAPRQARPMLGKPTQPAGTRYAAAAGVRCDGLQSDAPQPLVGEAEQAALDASGSTEGWQLNGEAATRPQGTAAWDALQPAAQAPEDGKWLELETCASPSKPGQPRQQPRQQQEHVQSPRGLPGWRASPPRSQFVRPSLRQLHGSAAEGSGLDFGVQVYAPPARVAAAEQLRRLTAEREAVEAGMMDNPWAAAAAGLGAGAGSAAQSPRAASPEQQAPLLHQLDAQQAARQQPQVVHHIAHPAFRLRLQTCPNQVALELMGSGGSSAGLTFVAGGGTASAGGSIGSTGSVGAGAVMGVRVWTASCEDEVPGDAGAEIRLAGAARRALAPCQSRGAVLSVPAVPLCAAARARRPLAAPPTACCPAGCSGALFVHLYYLEGGRLVEEHRHQQQRETAQALALAADAAAAANPAAAPEPTGAPPQAQALPVLQGAPPAKLGAALSPPRLLAGKAAAQSGALEGSPLLSLAMGELPSFSAPTSPERGLPGEAGARRGQGENTAWTIPAGIASDSPPHQLNPAMRAWAESLRPGEQQLWGQQELWREVGSRGSSRASSPTRARTGDRAPSPARGREGSRGGGKAPSPHHARGASSAGASREPSPARCLEASAVGGCPVLDDTRVDSLPSYPERYWQADSSGSSGGGAVQPRQRQTQTPAQRRPAAVPPPQACDSPPCTPGLPAQEAGQAAPAPAPAAQQGAGALTAMVNKAVSRLQQLEELQALVGDVMVAGGGGARATSLGRPGQGRQQASEGLAAAEWSADAPPLAARRAPPLQRSLEPALSDIPEGDSEDGSVRSSVRSMAAAPHDVLQSPRAGGGGGGQGVRDALRARRQQQHHGQAAAEGDVQGKELARLQLLQQQLEASMLEINKRMDASRPRTSSAPSSPQARSASPRHLGASAQPPPSAVAMGGVGSGESVAAIGAERSEEGMPAAWEQESPDDYAWQRHQAQARSPGSSQSVRPASASSLAISSDGRYDDAPLPSPGAGGSSPFANPLFGSSRPASSAAGGGSPASPGAVSMAPRLRGSPLGRGREQREPRPAPAAGPAAAPGVDVAASLGTLGSAFLGGQAGKEAEAEVALFLRGSIVPGAGAQGAAAGPLLRPGWDAARSAAAAQQGGSRRRRSAAAAPPAGARDSLDLAAILDSRPPSPEKREPQDRLSAVDPTMVTAMLESSSSSVYLEAGSHEAAAAGSPHLRGQPEQEPAAERGEQRGSRQAAQREEPWLWSSTESSRREPSGGWEPAAADLQLLRVSARSTSASPGCPRARASGAGGAAVAEAAGPNGEASVVPVLREAFPEEAVLRLEKLKAQLSPAASGTAGRATSPARNRRGSQSLSADGGREAAPRASAARPPTVSLPSSWGGRAAASPALAGTGASRGGRLAAGAPREHPPALFPPRAPSPGLGPGLPPGVTRRAARLMQVAVGRMAGNPGEGADAADIQAALMDCLEQHSAEVQQRYQDAASAELAAAQRRLAAEHGRDLERVQQALEQEAMELSQATEAGIRAELTAFVERTLPALSEARGDRNLGRPASQLNGVRQVAKMCAAALAPVLQVLASKELLLRCFALLDEGAGEDE